jgi:hypothetical protein
MKKGEEETTSLLQKQLPVDSDNAFNKMVRQRASSFLLLLKLLALFLFLL